MQPLNQAFNYQERPQTNQPAPTNNNSGKPTTTKEVKCKFEGNCRYCNIVGHMWIECRKRLRDEANGTYTKTQQRPQQTYCILGAYIYFLKSWDKTLVFHRCLRRSIQSHCLSSFLFLYSYALEEQCEEM